VSELARLQAAFQAYLLGGPADALAPAVADGAHAPAAELLQVYADAYALRLLEALETDYPTVAALVGAEAFDALGRAYIAAHPSRHPSIRWFGGQLAGFLAATPPWSATPALADLARWEHAMRAAFDAADAAPIDAAALAAVPPAAWPGLAFRLLPSFRRLDLRHDAVAVWRAVERGEEGIEPPPAAAEPMRWALWRPQLVTQFRSLPQDEAWALDAVAAGADFAGLCEGLAQWHPDDEVAGRAVALLRGWLEEGMLAEALLPPDAGVSGQAP